MEIVQKRVLITGASKGIGKAIAHALIDADYEVIGTSRDPDAIPKDNRIPGLKYYALEMNDYASIDQIVRKVGNIDILINNAGASQIGPVEEAPMSLVTHLFQINLFGIIYLTQKFLPKMREKKGGLIINISSMAGRMIVPFSSIYAATKHGLDGYAKGLRNEVKGFGIKIINICPYGIRTNNSPEKHYKEESPYLKMLLNVLQVRSQAHAKAPGTEAVAKKVIKVLRKKNPRFSYVVGGISPLLSVLNRVLPEKVVEKIQRKVFKLD
jgi:short-subunit dehydrogenase